jgi:hypothetical protein
MCLVLAQQQRIRMEMVQRLPEGVLAPTLKKDGRRCCFDCAAAETVERVVGLPSFVAARIAVGNDRQSQYRLPGVPMGLVMAGLVRPSAPGDLHDQHRWLERNNWFEVEECDG